MALPPVFVALRDRLAAYNNGPQSPTNTQGLARGGSSQGVFISFVADLVAFGTMVATYAGSSAGDAALTAEDARNTALDRIATAQDVVTSAGKVTEAAAQAAKLIGTSATSVTPSVAAKVFTTQADKYFAVGTYLQIMSAAAPTTRWMAGQVTAYNATTGALTVNVQTIGTVVTAASDWSIYLSGPRGPQGIQGIPGVATMPYAARSANTVLAQADSATIFDLSGTFTQTFVAAATLAANWYCILRNNGTGDITLDPAGSELIDGLTSYIMYPGEVRLVQCDGTQLRSIVLSAFYKTFTASANFIKPPGYQQFGGMIRSGGASGGRNGANVNSPGGGGGGAFPFNVLAANVAASSPIVVGAGAAAVTVDSSAGNKGGDSSFAGIVVGQRSGAVSALGGAINKLDPVSNTNHGIGFEPNGVTATGLTAIFGGGSSNNNGNVGITGSSLYGGGSGGSLSPSDVISPPGASTFAGSGGAASATADGTAGTIPSGGGGASRNGFASGAGARGQVEIYGVA